MVRIKGQWLKQGKLYMNKHFENFWYFSQHMGLCDNHHAKEQEDDAVTGGRHGPRKEKGSQVWTLFNLFTLSHILLLYSSAWPHCSWHTSWQSPQTLKKILLLLAYYRATKKQLKNSYRDCLHFTIRIWAAHQNLCTAIFVHFCNFIPMMARMPDQWTSSATMKVK